MIGVRAHQDKENDYEVSLMVTHCPHQNVIVNEGRIFSEQKELIDVDQLFFHYFTGNRNTTMKMNMRVDKKQQARQLADLLHQTAEDHHIAFKQTDGVDPDWSIWYADHLREKGIETLLDAKLLKSDLIYLLVLADKKQMSEAPGSRWENFYADFFVNRYLQD